MLKRSIVWRLSLVALLVLVAWQLYGRIDIPNCLTLQAETRKLGAWGPVIFVLLYVLGTVSFIPGTLLTLLAGSMFGFWLGTTVVIVGLTLGSYVAFLLGRYLLRDPLTQWMQKQTWTARLQSGLEGNGFRFMIVARLVPLFPFNAFNLTCGVLPLSNRDYLLGSFLGMLPGTMAYVYAGAAGCRLIDPLLRGELHWKDYPQEAVGALIAVSIILAMAIVTPWFLRRRL